jgi:hypothetical protein
VKIDRRRAQTAVSEQELDRSQISARFKQKSLYRALAENEREKGKKSLLALASEQRAA